MTIDARSIEDGHDRRLALRAEGLLATFNRADVLGAADVHVARRLGAMTGESDEQVLLATALAVRAVRQGSTCVDLATVADLPLEDDPALPWPDVPAWQATVERSPLVGERVLRVDNGLLYLDRYWREEVQVCDDLLARLARPAPEVDTAALDAGVLRVFPDAGYDEQRTAARAAAERWTTVLTGGPGTGKTTTVAGLLALLAEQAELESGGARRLRIALTAPTGKASARLQESVDAETRALPAADRARLGELKASTLHRLLGWRPDSSTRFRHDRGNRLPHDVVVVDETSMVSLTMMARLLEAVRADARLVLVGDPGQLASVEAGAVLADLVDGFGRRDGLPGGRAHDGTPVRRRHRRARDGAARRRRRPGGRGPALGWRRRAGRPGRRARDGGVPGDGHRGRARRTSRGGGGRRRRPQSPLSTGTGCCAPIVRAPTASPAGTVRSSDWSQTAPVSPTTTSGTPDAPCWSPPTTTARASTTATSA